MRFAPTKTMEQQADLMPLGLRAALIKRMHGIRQPDPPLGERVRPDRFTRANRIPGLPAEIRKCAEFPETAQPRHVR